MLAPSPSGYVVRSRAEVGYFLHDFGTPNGFSWEPGILKAHAFPSESAAAVAAGPRGEVLPNPFHRCENCGAVHDARCRRCHSD